MKLLVNVLALITSIVLVVLVKNEVIGISLLVAWLPTIIVCGITILLFASIGLIMVLNLKVGGLVLNREQAQEYKEWIK